VSGDVELGEFREELLAWHEEGVIQPECDVNQCALQIGAHAATPAALVGAQTVRQPAAKHKSI
jgi:hypothetical protein